MKYENKKYELRSAKKRRVEISGSSGSKLQTSDFRLLSGFTIIELLVVISIIAILSGIVLIDYRSGQQALALQRVANKLAQDIRKVQEMAMSARECTPPPASCPAGGGVPAGGYGFYINKNEIYSYKIYADDGESPKKYQYTNGETIETISLEKGVYIDNLIPSSANFSINFKPPDPIINIKNAAGDDKDNVTIIIALESDSSKTKTISINIVGRIEID